MPLSLARARLLLRYGCGDGKDRRREVRARGSPGGPHAPAAVDSEDHGVRGSAGGRPGGTGLAGGDINRAEAVDWPERRRQVRSAVKYVVFLDVPCVSRVSASHLTVCVCVCVCV